MSNMSSGFVVELSITDGETGEVLIGVVRSCSGDDDMSWVWEYLHEATKFIPSDVKKITPIIRVTPL